jgi:NAD(P)H-dependent FMN reductase
MRPRARARLHDRVARPPAVPRNTKVAIETIVSVRAAAAACCHRPRMRHPARTRSPTVIRIAIITGSTRPGRHSEAVARWVLELAAQREDAAFELVDIAQPALPLFDEPFPPSLGQYMNDHTKAWAAKIAPFDGFVFVTPEYNHGIPGALKNAIDYLFAEWNNKAAGFVSYGSVGGARSVEQLRLVLAELMVATVRSQVLLSLFTDFENFSRFAPHARHESEVGTLLNEVVAWARALKTLRPPR